MYDYLTPPGYGDRFFVYVYDGLASGITDGTSRSLLSTSIQDGDFVLRAYAGVDTMVDPVMPGTPGKIQLYDYLRRSFYSAPTSIPAVSPQGQTIIPESIYYDGGFIRFDLEDILVAANGAIKFGQLCFYGVKRVKGGPSDPSPSLYKYYEKPFSYPYSFTVSTAGSTTDQFGPYTQYTIPVEDFDFELRRINIGASTSAFNIVLFNNHWQAVSSRPMNATRMFYITPPAATVKTTGWNNWPSPPLLYPVNSVIRFNIYSKTATVPQTFKVTFNGVRRIPC